MYKKKQISFYLLLLFLMQRTAVLLLMILDISLVKYHLYMDLKNSREYFTLVHRQSELSGITKKLT